MAFKSEIHVAELASIRTGHTEGDIYYILDNGMLGELPCKPGTFVEWHNNDWRILADERYTLKSEMDAAIGEIGQPLKLIGSATVSQLNGTIEGLEPGWTYTLTDSGTLTAGSVKVEAGDEVAWSASEAWVKIGGDSSKLVIVNYGESWSTFFPKMTDYIAAGKQVFMQNVDSDGRITLYWLHEYGLTTGQEYFRFVTAFQSTSLPGPTSSQRTIITSVVYVNDEGWSMDKTIIADYASTEHGGTRNYQITPSRPGSIAFASTDGAGTNFGVALLNTSAQSGLFNRSPVVQAICWGEDSNHQGTTGYVNLPRLINEGNLGLSGERYVERKFSPLSPEYNGDIPAWHMNMSYYNDSDQLVQFQFALPIMAGGLGIIPAYKRSGGLGIAQGLFNGGNVTVTNLNELTLTNVRPGTLFHLASSGTVTNVPTGAPSLFVEIGDWILWDGSQWQVYGMQSAVKTESDVVNGVLSVRGNNVVTSVALTTLSTLTIDVLSSVPNFAIEIDNTGNSNDVTLNVTRMGTALKYSVAGGDTVGTGKYVQLTCVGSCWTLAEFTAS